MNTENLIPITYVKNITPLVVGDVIYNKFLKLSFEICSSDVDSYNSQEDAFYTYSLVSFADRPNTGNQPVTDDVSVDVTLENCNHGFAYTAALSWNIGFDSDIKSWKPNHAAMLSDYKKTQELKEESTPRTALKEGETIQVPYSELPITTHPQYDVLPVIPKPSSNDLELTRLVDFVTTNKLIIDGENPVDCVIRELAEKHDIDTRSDEDKAIEDLRLEFNCGGCNGILSAIKGDKIHGVQWVGE